MGRNEEVLAPFRALKGRKIPMDERLALIYRQFPSITQLDWNRAFAENRMLYARVWRDLLKSFQQGPTRPGPRPALEYTSASKRLHEIVAHEYTHLPFTEILEILTAGRSVRAMSAKTGLDRTRLFRLMKGSLEPDAYDMEAISKAFAKKPGFFLEYRKMFITRAILAQMDEVPEATVGPYETLRKAVAA